MSSRVPSGDRGRCFQARRGSLKFAFSHFQKHYFSCKNRFDINVLNSTYTKASSSFTTQVRALRLKFTHVANLLVHRWRIKACIKPWGSWICSLTTSRATWLQRGAAALPEEPQTWGKGGQSVSFWGCQQLLHQLLCSETSADRNCPEDKFSDHIVSLTYTPYCHL